MNSTTLLAPRHALADLLFTRLARRLKAVTVQRTAARWSCHRDALPSRASEGSERAGT
ncbi:hypothetical protein [Micromonospora sp. KC723]|uniref:hypothetical protein n=1 Tax=Micromonospora sp. KC723 TaxID=2530381 RepID=UPI001404E630|nr:hypothetical protein [Micromonospora sp. KC723]